jgi:chromosome partitioning protein
VSEQPIQARGSFFGGASQAMSWKEIFRCALLVHGPKYSHQRACLSIWCIVVGDSWTRKVRMSAFVIALISQKGGVGKTTSAVNLAAAFCERGQRVLLLDLDPQSSATLSMGIDRGSNTPSMADVFLRGLPLGKAIRSTGTPGLELVTASIDLKSLDREGTYSRQGETALHFKLNGVRDRYDAVFIDCPPSFNLLTRNAVAAADGFIVPAVPHFLAVEGIRTLIEEANRLRFRCQTRSAFLGILPTLVDYRVRVTRKTLNELREEFGRQVFAVEIRTNVRLAEAPAEGMTILDYDPKSTGAGSYRLAAEELLLRTHRLRDGTEVARGLDPPSRTRSIIRFG